MTAFEILSVVLDIMLVVIGFGSFVIALLNSSDKKNKRKK